MKNKLPVALAGKIDLFTDKRFGTFFDSIREFPAGEKIAVIEAASYIHNNDVILAHSLAMELKKAGRTDEAKDILWALPVVQVNVPVKKFGLILGSKGRTIKWLQVKYASRIDLEPDGTINIYSSDLRMAQGAAGQIEWMVRNTS